MKIDFIDVKRAYFHANAIRDVYVELSPERAQPGMCGRLNKALYGTRDAAQNWAYSYMEFMKSIGFKTGRSSSCVFWHPEHELRVVVHGDDFTALGWQVGLDWFWKEIQKRYDSRYPGKPQEKILNS